MFYFTHLGRLGFAFVRSGEYVELSVVGRLWALIDVNPPEIDVDPAGPPADSKVKQNIRMYVEIMLPANNLSLNVGGYR